MKISLKWLNEFVNLEQYFDRPEELSDLLTSAGLEVEGLENLRKQFEYVVIGQILRKSQHPDADKLTVCEVSVGKGVIHQIVCGAKNHKEEDFVVAALPGAVLPGDFKIKTSKLRGVESQGMLCSYKELGMEGDSEGIIILGPEASSQVGVAAADYFGMDDVLFELKVTPNRADCLSHFGLAREIASLLSKELQKPNAELKIHEASEASGPRVSVELRNQDLCPRYCGRMIRDVQVGESPAWLKARLESLGMNSINNVVDVTNYVMLELGQPLHAFDTAKLSGQKIIVENSSAGEEFQTLDGTKIKLTGEELMIKDASRAVALAGVVGGLNSGVDETTKNIFIESAYFLPQAVRKSSRRFGIDTDSAYRFSRGVDPTGADFARDRACYLIAEVAGGKVLGEPLDIYPRPLTQEKIEISAELVTESLGYKVTTEELVQVLSNLSCEVEQMGSEGVLRVLPPPFRVDLEQAMDLVEEYARVKGYDKIPESLPATLKGPEPHDERFSKRFQLSDDLIGLGFFEARNFAFTSSKDQKELLGPLEDLENLGLGKGLGSAVALRNPLNDELDVMRTAVTPSLFKNVITNLRRGNESGKLFEIAPVFGVDGTQYKEQHRLGLVAWGQEQGLWESKPVPKVFILKSAIEVILKRLQVSSYKWVQEATKNAPLSWPALLHPGQSAYLMVEGKPVGFIGSLHPAVKEQEKLRQDIALAELDLDSLLNGRPRPYRVQPISKFPAVERDLALVMPADLAVGQVIAGINKIGGNLLQSVSVFDIYEGDKLPEGQKSVAFRMRLQSRDSTLSDKELGEWQQQLTTGLSAQFPVTVR